MIYVSYPRSVHSLGSQLLQQFVKFKNKFLLNIKSSSFAFADCISDGKVVQVLHIQGVPFFWHFD